MIKDDKQKDILEHMNDMVRTELGLVNESILKRKNTVPWLKTVTLVGTKPNYVYCKIIEELEKTEYNVDCVHVQDVTVFTISWQ